MNVVMTTPVKAAGTGITFDLASIVAWQSLRGNTCPVTGGDLGELKPDVELIKKIADWQCKKNQNVYTALTAIATQSSEKQVYKRRATASTFIASKKRKIEKKKIDPKQFDKVVRLVQFFTAFEIKDSMKRSKQEGTINV